MTEASLDTKSHDESKMMNFSSGNLYLTYSIIAVNVIVFLLMAFNGVPILSPTGIDIIRWGGNFGPLTQSGDWWRLITCMFVHIGVIHLAFNMYALYMIGIYLEPMLGKTRFFIAYLCSGVIASLVSLWWHDTPVASAGASGAIFGMYGVFLALLSTNLIPKDTRDSLLKSIGIFIVYNLVYGMRSGVDNAAHVGGLVSGAVIGYIFYSGIKQGSSRNRNIALMGIVSVATIACAYFYLENRKVSEAERSTIMSELEFFRNDGAEEYSTIYDQIIALQDSAIAPLNSSFENTSEKLEKINSISRPAWNKADSLVKELQLIGAGNDAKKRAIVLQEYITWRIKEMNVIEEMMKQPSDSLQLELNEITSNINRTVEELSKKQDN